MLAALFTLTSPVPGMTFFPGILSIFLAYLYTSYCFLTFFSLKSEMQGYHWKCFIQGLVTHRHGTCITGIYNQMFTGSDSH